MSENLNAMPLTLRDYPAAAQARCSAPAWAYFSGGAGDEISLHANERAWSDLQLQPRVLADLRAAGLSRDLMGRTWPKPLMVAPVGHLRWANAGGEAAAALGAVAVGAGFCLSQLTSMPMQHVAQVAHGEPQRGGLWMQLMWQGLDATLAMMAQAQASGFEAVVLTVDAPVQGIRDRELRSGGAVPESVRSVYPMPAMRLPSHDFCQGMLLQAPRWADVRELIAQAPLPVVVKGVSHPKDALLAIEAGARALWVSNHGARTLDTVPATAHSLPAVARAVQGAVPLIVDGGIRRGTDVFKALALGASLVAVGRPAAFGFAAAGAQGMAHVLKLLGDELAACMALCGCAQLSDVTSEALFVHDQRLDGVR